jgi:hypothetical protein
MKTFVLTSLAAASIVFGLHAQENSKRVAPQFAASVSELKGACYVREGNESQPQKLKLNDELRAGQQVSCDRKARLKILFHGSGSVKEIKKRRPDWYKVPNVTLRQRSSDKTFSRAGREKGQKNNNSNNNHTPRRSNENKSKP